MSRWKLRNREVCITTRASGQWVYYDIRILWSQKLGLKLDKHFKSLASAAEIVHSIEQLGTIDPDKWIKDYYPNSRFLEDYSD